MKMFAILFVLSVFFGLSLISQDAFAFKRGKSRVSAGAFAPDEALKNFYIAMKPDKSALRPSDTNIHNLPACEKDSTFEFPAPSAINGSCEFVVVNKAEFDKLKAKLFAMHSPSAEFMDLFKITCVPARITIKEGKIKVTEGSGALK